MSNCLNYRPDPISFPPSLGWTQDIECAHKGRPHGASISLSRLSLHSFSPLASCAAANWSSSLQHLLFSVWGDTFLSCLWHPNPFALSIPTHFQISIKLSLPCVIFIWCPRQHCEPLYFFFIALTVCNVCEINNLTISQAYLHTLWSCYKFCSSLHLQYLEQCLKVLCQTFVEWMNEQIG